MRDVLPSPWSARSRVHEYSGLCFAGYDAGDGPALVFAEWSDQRLYRLAPGDADPVPLTPKPAEPAGDRFADLVLDRAAARVLAVRESHVSGSILRSIVAIPLDGSGSDDPAAIQQIVAGTDFLANPRLSPDRGRLAWIGWDHPNMPWDATTLFVADVDSTGVAQQPRAVLGGPEESISQVEWADATSLYAVSDRSGWWNLYRVRIEDAQPPAQPLLRAEVGAPLWQLGGRTVAPLSDGSVAVLHGVGSLRLGLLDPVTGALVELASGYDTWSASLATNGRAVVGVGASIVNAPMVLHVERHTERTSVLSAPTAPLPPEGALPRGQHAMFAGPADREVHAHVYEPRSAAAIGPPDEAPP